MTSLTLAESAVGASSLTTVTPAPADSLVNSFGVVVHPNWGTSVYADHARLLYWLGELGVRHVRTRFGTQSSVLDLYADMNAADIKVNAVFGGLGEPQRMSDLMDTVVRRFRNPDQVFSAFEGINEPNNNGVRWIDETRAKTQDLFNERARHGLEAIPIVAPALARVTTGGVEGDDTLAQARNLGSLAAWTDIGNIHVYPRGLQPSTDIDYFTQCSREVTGSSPVACTEGGYFTSAAYQGGAQRVPSGVAASYGPQKILEHFIAGNKRYFRYELFEQPDMEPRLATLGLVRAGNGWTPKPEFRTTRRLLRKFSDPGPTFAPAKLTYSLTEAPSDLRSAVFAKRDGTHLLALWLDRPVWSPRTDRMLVDGVAAKLDSVLLTLGTARSGRVSRLVSNGPSYSLSSSQTHRLGLTSGVTIVRLDTLS